MKQYFYILLLITFNIYSTIAQCSMTEAPIFIEIITEAFGSEVNWTLSNDETGEVYAESGFYGDFQTYTAQVCVPLGTSLAFTISCCINNEGFFNLELFDIPVVTGSTYLSNEVIRFKATQPIALGASIPTMNLAETVLAQPHFLTGTIKNLGLEPITSFEISWQIGEGSIFTHPVNDVAIATFETYTFEHSTPWMATVGEQELKVWASKLNGMSISSSPQDNWLDTLQVVQTLSERKVLVEVFTNASCSVCAAADPEVSFTALGNLAKITPIFYHVSYPGPDLLYDQSKESVDHRFLNYSPVGTPTSIAEGIEIYTPAPLFNSARINQLQQKPALFSIGCRDKISTINETQIAEIDAIITPYHHLDMTDNLRVYIAIVEQEVSFETAPGFNGLTHFFFVLREFLLDGHDISLTDLQENQSKTLKVRYELPTYVVPEQLRVAIFIQNYETKEVYQSFFANQTLGTNRTGNTTVQGTNFGSVQIKVQHPSCNSNQDGEIQVEAQGKHPPFQYEWLSFNTQNSTLNHLKTGVYQIKVTDVLGVSDTIQVDLPPSSLLEVSIETTPDVDNLGTGTATLQVADSLPVNYQWQDGFSGHHRTDLRAGDYQVSVTDSYGCYQIEHVTITTATAVGGLDFPISSTYQIYPNPVQSTLKIKFNHRPQEKVMIEVINMLGQNVQLYKYQQLFSRNNVYAYDLSKLAEGLYFIKIYIGEKVFSEKLFVSR